MHPKTQVTHSPNPGFSRVSPRTRVFPGLLCCVLFRPLFPRHSCLVLCHVFKTQQSNPGKTRVWGETREKPGFGLCVTWVFREKPGFWVRGILGRHLPPATVGLGECSFLVICMPSRAKKAPLQGSGKSRVFENLGFGREIPGFRKPGFCGPVSASGN